MSQSSISTSHFIYTRPSIHTPIWNDKNSNFWGGWYHSRYNPFSPVLFPHFFLSDFRWNTKRLYLNASLQLWVFVSPCRYGCVFEAVKPTAFQTQTVDIVLKTNALSIPPDKPSPPLLNFFKKESAQVGSLGFSFPRSWCFASVCVSSDWIALPLAEENEL